VIQKQSKKIKNLKQQCIALMSELSSAADAPKSEKLLPKGGPQSATISKTPVFEIALPCVGTFYQNVTCWHCAATSK